MKAIWVADFVGNGIVADMWTTKYSEMKSIDLAVPSIQEQVAITSYLDRATGQIDALVRKKTRFIELLRRRRHALITRSVTKGLVDGVATRDSGVIWLGNARESAMNGNIKGTVQAAVVRAMLSHQAQAEHLLKADQQALSPFTALIYELLKAGKNIDLGESGS